MRARATIFAILIAIFAALPSRAQSCTTADTWRTCYLKVTGREANTQVGDAVEEAVAKTNTGKPDLSSISNTTLRDFLSFFTAAVGTSTVEQKDNQVTIDFNFPVNLLHDKDVVKLQATFGKPEIDTGLKTALGDNADAITALNDGFDEADDVTASVTYSPQTRNFGRMLSKNSDLYDSLLWAAVVRAGTLPSGDVLIDAQHLATIAVALQGAPNEVIRSQNPLPFSTIPDATRSANAVATFETAIRAVVKTTADTAKLTDQFAELVNNQRQIYFSAQYRDRNSFAGANAWSVKATWESGGKNLSSFFADNAVFCDLGDMAAELTATSAPKSGVCLTKFEEYVKSIDRTWRWAFSADVQRTESNLIVLPQHTINLSTPQADSQIISASIGRRFDPPTSTRERRIDFTGSYQNVSDDEELNDRLVASVTYTQEITDSFTLPITLTYANNEKHLTEEDGDRLGVHFAISYKLPNQ
jgi:hypothetical protein